jgi:hypothetical protein
MGGLSYNPDLSDVLQNYQATRITVSTTEVEAKVGASRNANRQLIAIYNDSSTTVVYYGPTGVTASGGFGLPLNPGQAITLSLGNAGIFLITASGSAPVIIQELS